MSFPTPSSSAGTHSLTCCTHSACVLACLLLSSPHHRQSPRTFRPRLRFVEVVWLARSRRKDVGRRNDRRVFVGSEVSLRRMRWPMHRSVAEPQIPRFARVSVLAADVLARPLRIVVGRV